MTRPRIEQHGALGANDQVAVVLLVVSRLTDREGAFIQRLHRKVVVVPPDISTLVQRLGEGGRSQQADGVDQNEVALRHRNCTERSNRDQCDQELLHQISLSV